MAERRKMVSLMEHTVTIKVLFPLGSRLPGIQDTAKLVAALDYPEEEFGPVSFICSTPAADLRVRTVRRPVDEVPPVLGGTLGMAEPPAAKKGKEAAA